MTILRTRETDGVLAPSEFELEALDRRINWPGFEVLPTTRCGFKFYVQYRKINHARGRFHRFLVKEGRDPHVDVLTVAQWDSLRAMFDIRDERETLLDVRYAGCP